MLICIDGLDESKNREYWLTKILEAKSYETIYQDIKFVFLSRHSFFKSNNDKKDLWNCINYLPPQSDVNIDELFNKYIDYYDIKIDGYEWIKNILKTPLSIKLFCNLYSGHELDITSERQLVITSLIKNKYDRVGIRQ